MALTRIHMWLHIGLVALLQAVPPSQTRLGAATPPYDAATDAPGYAALRFLTTWRSAWLASVDWRGYGHADVRLRDDHCHWDGSFSIAGPRGYNKPPGLIHRSSRRSMCPDWFPADERVPGDESFDLDVSLTPAVRERVRAARAMLIDSLAFYGDLHRGDAWITGERVRFLVDQDDAAAAIEVARHCTADRVWCAQLAGFAFNAAHDYVHADSAFDAASALMDPEKRCQWTSARLLLDEDGRSAYDRMSCDQRAAANERLWWLSTPLFSDSNPDRRSEDFNRKVLVQLHRALPWDERYDWRERFGGDAVAEMLIRYGWPAFSAFAGMNEELSHASWMNFYDSTRTATAEYPQDRLHLIPDWRAIADPFHASSDAWQLNMPRLTGEDEPAAQWWPAEHYARASGGIVQLPEQTVMLRRDTDVLLATAADARRASHVLHGDTARTSLVRTTGPHAVEMLRHETFVNATSIVVTAHVAAEPAVVGTEVIASQRNEPAARTRLGIAPPLPLNSFRPGETGISEPVLLNADGPIPATAEEALHQMLGTTRVTSTKVGVYWETYGYAPGDSIDVAVVIVRHESISKIRRLGMMLHVAHDLNGSVAVRWGEPQAGHESWTIPGILPIHARSIRLDLSQIEPGHYTVQVMVGRKGGMPVLASREIVYGKI
ncbi:MAG: hypothetical protein ACREPM_14200 [Gemmatimonadaceae bacterium]